MAASAFVIRQKADRVGSLLQSRYGLSGDGLGERLSRGRRRLPSDLRRAADRLAEAERMTMQPKLLLRIDDTAVDRDYRLLVRRLESMPNGAHRNSVLSSVGQSVMTTLLSLTVIGIGAIGWATLH